jgi:hypothetical protein
MGYLLSQSKNIHNKKPAFAEYVTKIARFRKDTKQEYLCYMEIWIVTL